MNPASQPRSRTRVYRQVTASEVSLRLLLTTIECFSRSSFNMITLYNTSVTYKRSHHLNGPLLNLFDTGVKELTLKPDPSGKVSRSSAGRPIVICAGDRLISMPVFKSRTLWNIRNIKWFVL